MSHSSASARRRGTTYPTNAWYAVATSDEVGRTPLARRAVDLPVVLWRLESGRAVALEDRDAHRPYPLSLGRVAGDTIVSGYSGFAYGQDGTCVFVPTQPQVPFGAKVRAFPTREQHGLVWVWPGDPGWSGLRPPPPTPWLADPAWATFGDAWLTRANVLLLHENFADITHVAVVDPYISPPVLNATPPPLEVEVAETTVAFHRDYPPARLAPWHAEVLGLDPELEHRQREEGAFVAPGLWVDRWDVTAGEATHAFRFTHAVTPVSSNQTRHIWRVSRNFAPDEATTQRLRPIFSDYYRTVRDILETMQTVVDTDGQRTEVSVASDAAALQVRKIIGRLVADERGG
ncbi:MAG TPA: aromatic ring-hydroxylating dioxygenase subunit alpha [Dermatophilaceae bacterium]|nr:aromatic ring-hydroxylating dioxygenase subunit alpha [Dermatophilaceae bacterium]